MSKACNRGFTISMPRLQHGDKIMFIIFSLTLPFWLSTFYNCVKPNHVDLWRVRKNQRLHKSLLDAFSNYSVDRHVIGVNMSKGRRWSSLIMKDMHSSSTSFAKRHDFFFCCNYWLLNRSFLFIDANTPGPKNWDEITLCSNKNQNLDWSKGWGGRGGSNKRTGKITINKDRFLNRWHVSLLIRLPKY